MKLFVPATFAATLALAAHWVAAQSTAITYQGEISQFGQPATGSYDLRFKLFDSSVGGTQVGSTVCVDNVTVADGRFTAAIDFGQQFAATAPRFLEIDVRPGDAGTCAITTGYTTLTSRQALTTTPRAAAANVANALAAPDGAPSQAVFVDNAGNVGVGTTAPTELLDVRTPTGAYFKVDTANGDLRMNGGPDGHAGLFSDGPSTGSFAILSAQGARLQLSNNGNVGIGTASPQARLHVVGGDLMAGAQGQEWLFHTRSSFGSDFLQITDYDNGTPQFQRGLVLTPLGRVGINTTAPAATLHVVGSARVDGSITIGTQTRHLTVHGSAFRQANPTAGGAIFDQRGVRSTIGSGGQDFWAPVNLPNGANVTEVRIAFIDNILNQSAFISVGYGRSDFQGGTLELATVDSSLFNNSTLAREWSTNIIDYPTVDNATHSYWLRATIPGTTSAEGRLFNVRITYTVTSPLP
jgi:hypothetical protein